MGSSFAGLPSPAAAFRSTPNTFQSQPTRLTPALCEGNQARRTLLSLARRHGQPGASTPQKPLILHGRPASRCLCGVPFTSALRVKVRQGARNSTSIACVPPRSRLVPKARAELSSPSHSLELAAPVSLFPLHPTPALATPDAQAPALRS
jgi:hypothetical protein